MVCKGRNNLVIIQIYLVFCSIYANFAAEMYAQGDRNFVHYDNKRHLSSDTMGVLKISTVVSEITPRVLKIPTGGTKQIFPRACAYAHDTLFIQNSGVPNGPYDPFIFSRRGSQGSTGTPVFLLASLYARARNNLLHDLTGFCHLFLYSSN